jgi:hypothetical protein
MAGLIVRRVLMIVDIVEKVVSMLNYNSFLNAEQPFTLPESKKKTKNRQLAGKHRP